MTATINPLMSLPRDKYPFSGCSGKRVARWLLPAALLALAPKCVLCVLAYVGLGAALGLNGPEWCGVESSGAAVSWATALAWLGIVAGVGAASVFAKCRWHRSDTGIPRAASNGAAVRSFRRRVR